MKKLLAKFLLLGGVMAMLIACDPAEKYKEEIASIDTALMQVDSAQTLFENMPFDTLNALFAKVKEDMAFVQENYKGEMPLEQGVIFSRYRDVPNNLKHLSDQVEGIQKGIGLSKDQLNNLKAAILEGANRDAAGNSINEGYIKKNVNTETKLAADLVKQMKKMSEKGEKAFEDYQTYYPQVKGVLDSLHNVVDAR
jgi:hypothetical protein